MDIAIKKNIIYNRNMITSIKKYNAIVDCLNKYNEKQPGNLDSDDFVYEILDDNKNFIAGVEFEIHAEWLFIGEIAVIEEYRRKGIGTRMLKEVEEFAKSKGCEKAYLYTTNFQAPEFYKKCGYHIEHTREYKDTTRNKHLMVKSL